jgi:hypothetical protein
VGRDYLVYSLPGKLGERHSSPSRSEVRGESSVGREQGEGHGVVWWGCPLAVVVVARCGHGVVGEQGEGCGSWQWATSIGGGGVVVMCSIFAYYYTMQP